MNTTTIINKKSVVWNLEEMAIGVLVKAELISKGFEGSYYLGKSVPTGKQIERVSIFVRSATTGNFDFAF